MKSSEFKTFCNIIANADNSDPIWSASFAFTRLTTRQHAKIWDILDKRGFEHKKIQCFFVVFDGIILPSGLVMLKGGNGELW